MEAESFQAQSEGNKYCDTVANDLKKILPKMAKTTKAVRLICVNADKKPDAIATIRLMRDLNKN